MHVCVHVATPSVCRSCTNTLRTVYTRTLYTRGALDDCLACAYGRRTRQHLDADAADAVRLGPNRLNRFAIDVVIVTVRLLTARAPYQN